MILETAHIVMDSRADLDYIRIRQHGAHKPAHTHLVDSEQKSLVDPGKLQKRDMVVRMARSEYGAGLGVETYDFLIHQISDSPGIFQPYLVYHANLSREGPERHFLYFFRLDANFEHTNLVSI